MTARTSRTDGSKTGLDSFPSENCVDCIWRRDVAAEVVAMISGRGVEPPAEGSVYGLGCAETAGLGALFDGRVGGPQQATCGLEPDGFDVICRGDPYLCREDPGEPTFGQVDLSGQRRHG